MTHTRLEQETGIIWNEEEPTATIWTTSPVWKRRFSRQFGPGIPKGSDCLEWIVERRQLTVRKKTARAPRVLSEAQRKALHPRKAAEPKDGQN